MEDPKSCEQKTTRIVNVSYESGVVFLLLGVKSLGFDLPCLHHVEVLLLILILLNYDYLQGSITHD